jgi:hypothetical protein
MGAWGHSREYWAVLFVTVLFVTALFVTVPFVTVKI